jgi:hypothetical protein
MEVGFSETGQPVLKPRIEFSPPAAVQPTNFFGIDYLAGLKLLEASLQESNLTIWIALDRLACIIRETAEEWSWGRETAAKILSAP